MTPERQGLANDPFDGFRELHMMHSTLAKHAPFRETYRPMDYGEYTQWLTTDLEEEARKLYEWQLRQDYEELVAATVEQVNRRRSGGRKQHPVQPPERYGLG